MSRRTKEHGNILFLILLAVVLFAALSYAVTSSLRGGGKDGMSNEAANAAAADIMSWFTQIDTAVQRMRLVNNVPLEQIDFNDPNNMMQTGALQPYDNSSCTTASCEVFNANGGGVVARVFEKYADLTADTGTVGLRKPGYHVPIIMNVQNVGTSLNEVGMRIDYIKAPICAAINRGVGLPECSPTTQFMGTGTFASFAGNASTIDTALNTPVPYNFGGNGASKHTICSITCGATSGLVYHVVMER